jgi:hypothetical protein
LNLKRQASKLVSCLFDKQSNMLKIERIESGGILIKKTEYKVTTENDSFEAVLTVSDHEKTAQPYVQQIKASKGEQKLEHYSFWTNLQNEVITFHKKQ